MFLGNRSFFILFLFQRVRVHPKRKEKRKREKSSSPTTLVFHPHLCANIRRLPTSYLRVHWMIKKAFNGNLVCAIFKYTLTPDSIQSPLGEIGSINAQDIILTLLISSIIDLLEER
jgi:hypothetical protein